MKIILISFIVLFSAHLNAQTKPVAFRSHSGNMKYFSMAEPDNLGWGGTPMKFNAYDSTAIFTNLPPDQIDTSTNKPYCNNPNIPKDSLESNFPFYTTVVNGDTAATRTPDTLAKPKEHIKSRNEVEKNYVAPVGENSNGDTNSLTPNFNFILALFLIMLGIGTLIWLTNRKKVLPSA